MTVEPPPDKAVDAIVRTALAEDRARDDVTTQAVVDPDLVARARLVAREAGVVCGLGVAARLFATLDDRVTFEAHTGEGGGRRRRSSAGNRRRAGAGDPVGGAHGP